MNPKLVYTEILDLIDTFDPITYARTRNHLAGAVSKLSPYITRGVISLPAIKERILQRYPQQSAEKFIQELAWREYFQKVYFVKGREIFSDLRFSREDWRHHEIVTSIETASTEILVIDVALKELYATGYMHNHARMWTAMLACNVVKAHWFNMSRWMFFHLLDGDLASNTLSWQWVAGTSVQKQYVANQDLINSCSNTRQTESYLNIPVELVGTMEVPDVLIPHKPFGVTMQYPTTSTLPDMSERTVFLYHPWGIDPCWRKDQIGERIFILEPRLFDEFPVSSQVLDHILSLLKTHIPEATIFVGNVETIPGIQKATVYTKAHPTTTHFPGQQDAPEELFPHVHGYHQSFFKFWQACQKD